MQVRKQNINIGKSVFEGDLKTSAEGSIIVPDINPDILKVLQVDAEAFLCEKIIENGKLTLKGRVNINVLYLPESDEQCVHCIKSCFDFCETVKRAEFEDGMNVTACCDAEKVSYKIINSRKISVEAQLLIGVQVSADMDCCFVSDVEEDTVQSQYKTVTVSEKGICREFSFSADETIDIPSDNGMPSEILKHTVSIYNKEYRCLQGKLVVKGSLNACILYLTDNQKCRNIEAEIPFTEVFDIEELGEETLCDITYSVGDCSFILKGSMAEMSAQITLNVKTEHQDEFSILSDCYFTDTNEIISYETFENEEIVARPIFSAVMKEILQKDSSLPEISGVYTVSAKPFINATQIQNGRLAVSGRTTVYILYTADNPQMPVCSISEDIPFSYIIDCDCREKDAQAMLSCECEHVSYTINSANSIEIRCGISIKGKIVKKQQVRVISDVASSPIENQKSGIIVYFTKKDDMLWDISKRYHVKAESIISANGLEEDAVFSGGEKLIIPVCRA